MNLPQEVMARTIAIASLTVLLAGCIPGLPTGAGGGLVNACVLCIGSEAGITTTGTLEPEGDAEADTDDPRQLANPALAPKSAAEASPAPPDGAGAGPGAAETDAAPPASGAEPPPKPDPELILRLQEVEGLSLDPYPDVGGVEHICYGHRITVRTCDRLLAADMEIAAETAERVVGEPTWSLLAECRQHVVVELAFMLGDARLRAFDRMLAALRGGDHDAAATEISMSTLVPRTRVAWLAEAMRECA